MREWRGRSHDVLVLDDGFSWQGTHYRSLSAIARKITGTAWSGPLFFGLRSNCSPTRPPAKASAPVTRLMREWQGRSYEVLVLDDGFLWQGTHYRSLSAIARQITGTAWSGPLFFGLRSNRSATRSPSPASVPVDQPTEARNAAG